MKRVGVVLFPGSNCEQDCVDAVNRTAGLEAVVLWHRESVPRDIVALILPGGFTHGDYLRPGALAARSLIMDDVVRCIDRGMPVAGICNGFQILVEAGQLPGALLANQNGRFVCREQFVRIAGENGFFPVDEEAGRVLSIPVAHHTGRYYINKDGLQSLLEYDQIALRYCDSTGAVYSACSPNGSVDNIAAVLNRKKNVIGMMPHPERATELLPSGCDGIVFFEGLLNLLQ